MKSVFLTGHTGFKGAWLTVLLKSLGFAVHGFSDVTRPESLYEKARLRDLMTSEEFGDIRDLSKLSKAISKSKADLVVHFAAQPLVLKSYSNPIETFEVNINGTLNALEASLQAGCKRILIITTDKVYKDTGLLQGYSELDPLQGWDPYAASKAAADIVAQSWLELHRKEMRVDIARGGNVIAGGDDSEFRLVPDIERSIANKGAILLRNSSQVRPWQHALDCLDGYLTIASGPDGKLNTWNVGPSDSDLYFTAGEFTKLYLQARGVSVPVLESAGKKKETAFLKLDSSQICRELTWQPRWQSKKAITMTAVWHKRVQDGEDPRLVTISQVESFLETSRA